MAYPWLSRPDLRNLSYHQLSFLSLITTIQPILRNTAEIVVKRDVSPLESNRSDTSPILLQIETPKEDEKRDRFYLLDRFHCGSQRTRSDNLNQFEQFPRNSEYTYARRYLK